ncbi:MAG: class I SAM-dependent methyltransferase [Acidobacteriota bacterium]|nr:class I SAM-dependent methyltransferase [Acidobacteriota bacterium]
MIPGIPGKIHYNDFMLDSTDEADIDHYMSAARSTVAQLEESLAAAGKTWHNVQSMLEFGAGYGRITRLLVQKIHPSKLTVCDVIDESSRFCAEEFKVGRVTSTPDIQAFRAAPSDLVFFLSVQTHLSLTRLEQLQYKLMSLLKPGGVVHFTTMGMTSANNISRYGERWVKEQSRILGELRDSGFSFTPYGYYNDPDYGMTWETEEHVAGTMQRLHGDSMRLLLFSPGAEDGHQDIYVYQRV